MKTRHICLISPSLVSPAKLSAFLNEISDIADLDEITGEIIYDDDEETEKKIVEILDKYFL